MLRNNQAPDSDNMRSRDNDRTIKLRIEELSKIIIAMTAKAECSHLDLAEAYFKRAICNYFLGNRRMAESDLNGAGLLGCQEALLWSRYDIRQSAGTWKNFDRSHI
ncbi:MAG: hypothetical protein KFF50_06245 [Desulfatitalea sp.]|nr:hypothetical protein [Desulfatitalea sp.]